MAVTVPAFMYLQPKTSSGVLTDAMSQLSRTWGRLTTLGLSVLIPTGILTFLVFRWLRTGELTALMLDPEGFGSRPQEIIREVAGPYLLGAAATMAIQFAASVFVTVVSCRVVASDIGGDSVSLGYAVRAAVRRYPLALIAATVIGAPVALALIGGLGVRSNLVLSLLFFIPGLWLLASVSMTIPVLVIERSGVVSSVVRSFSMVRGRRLATLGFLVGIGLLGLVATLLIQLAAIPMVAMGADSSTLKVTAVLGVIFQGIVIGSLGAPLMAWYVDLRARIEPLSRQDLL